MGTRYGDVDATAAFEAGGEPDPVSGTPVGRSGAGSTLVSSLLYGTLVLGLTCGPMLIPGIGLKAALLWIVGGGTLVFLGLLLWAIVRSLTEVSGNRRRRK